MLTKSYSHSGQQYLFHNELLHQLDAKDPLIQLADAIDWSTFDSALAKHYSKNKGRPSKPVRVMVSLLMLKQLENLSDESVVVQFKRNPYYQYFAGYPEYKSEVPCINSDIKYLTPRIEYVGA